MTEDEKEAEVAGKILEARRLALSSGRLKCTFSRCRRGKSGKSFPNVRTLAQHMRDCHFPKAAKKSKSV